MKIPTIGLLAYIPLLVIGCSNSSKTDPVGAVQPSTEKFVGTWVVDVPGSKQLRPEFDDPNGFFLILNADGNGNYGSKGGEIPAKWVVQGDAAEGKEISLNSPTTNELSYILNVKIIDADHLEVNHSSYCGNCRMARVAALPPGYNLANNAPKEDRKASRGSRKVSGVLVSFDGPTGVATITGEGAEQKFTTGKEQIKYIGFSGGVTNVRTLLKKNVVVYLAREDGKEVVIEIHEGPRPQGPSESANKLDGVFKKLTTKGKSSTITIDANGTERDYPIETSVRVYAANGEESAASHLRNMKDLPVTLVIQMKDGKEVVTELWFKK